MIEVRNVVGRLIEVRARSPLSEADIQWFRTEFRSLVLSSQVRVVVCADVSELCVLSCALSAELLEIMRADNPSIERSAFLLSPDRASVELQFHRLVSQAGTGKRQIFFEAGQIARWLSPVLSPREKSRLAAFMGAEERLAG